ncbi:MAG: ATP synthase F0 subunit B [Candidatus Melainabacteria bacterium]|nr:ATP synthase F0 subunit B [Candidatus Melainabacteria bacterium]
MTTLTAPTATVTNTYKQTSIYKHMDLLEHLIDDAAGIYKFKLINADDFLDILDKARARLPEELSEAAEVLSQRDQILAESQRRSEQIVAQARRQAEQMLHESELLKAVQAEVERIRKQVVTEIEQMRREALAEAERIRMEADEDATRIKDGADHYAENVLTRMEKDLVEIGQHVQDSQNIIRNGQKLIGQAKRVPNMQAGQGQHQPQPHMPAHLSSPLLSPRTE